MSRAGLLVTRSGGRGSSTRARHFFFYVIGVLSLTVVKALWFSKNAGARNIYILHTYSGVHVWVAGRCTGVGTLGG